MTEFGCFVHMTDTCNFNVDSHSGHAIAFTGPGDVPNFDALAGYPGQAWNKRVISMTTGDATWVKLYHSINYGGDVVHFGPNSTIRDLRDVGAFDKATCSMRVYAARPTGWPGNATHLKRGTVISDMQRASANKVVKDAATTVIGAIPGVGDVVSTLLDILWPSGPSSVDTLQAIQDWASDRMHDLIGQFLTDVYQNKLLTLARHMDAYRKEPNATQFAILYGAVDDAYFSFVKPTSASDGRADSVYYLTIYGTIALFVYRAAHFQYAQCYGKEPTAQNATNTLARLTSAIAELRQAVDTQFASARAARMAMVTMPPSTTKLYQGWFAQDSYSGWRTPEFTNNYQGGDPYATGVVLNAEATANANVPYFQLRYAGPSFDAEFQVYREVADIWSYFDVAEPRAAPLPNHREVSRMGAWGRPYQPTSNSGNADFEYRWKETSKLTHITLHGGEFVDGFRLYVDGKELGWGGKIEQKGQSVVEIPISATERITAVFGAWGAKVDRLSFRLQPTDATGNASAFPNEPGLGHSTGGLPFSCAGPDGGNGVLTGLFGQVDRKGYLSAIGCYWTHDRIDPRVEPGTAA